MWVTAVTPLCDTISQAQSATSMDYVIRPATLADIEGIRQVARITWHATYAHCIAAHIRARFLEQAYATHTLSDTLNQQPHWFYVATLAKQVIGYAQYVIRYDTQWELVRLYVHPDHQRRGIGRSFLWMGAAAMLAAGADACYASVAAENAPALAFYQRCGFRPQRRYARLLADQMIELVELRASLADMIATSS